MLRLVVSGALIAAWSVLGAVPAHALSCGTAGSWHDGYYSTPATTTMTNLYGVRMDAQVLSPNFCPGNTSNFSNVYDMSFSNPNYTNFGWSQAGFERGVSGGPHPGIRHFAQIANGSSLDTWYSASTISTGTTVAYKVRDVNSAPTLNTTIDYVSGSAVLMGGTTNWVSPFEIELSAEARYKGDDVAGTTANKEDLTSIQYLNKSDNAFYDMPAGIFTTFSVPSNWHHNSISGTHKTLWSDPTN